MEKLAPVILFTYNRPIHTEKTLKALATNSLALETELFIYSDGAKELADEEQVLATRKISEKYMNSFKQIHIVNAKINKGLAESIKQGVTEICSKYGEVIVLEDDIVTSHNFLRFMNDCLRKYEFQNKVMAISGYMYKVKLDCEDDVILLPFISSWGWATWKRAWDLNKESPNFLNKLNGNKNLIYKFNLNGTYPYFEMLRKKNMGSVNSWAIDWYSTVFFNNGLSAFPRESLVVNIGFDGTGENCKARSIKQSVPSGIFMAEKFPDTIETSTCFEHIIQNLPKASINLISIFNNIKKRLGRAILKV